MVLISITDEDFSALEKHAELLKWNIDEAIHLAIKRWIDEANPIWDTKGQNPFKLLQEMWHWFDDESETEKGIQSDND